MKYDVFISYRRDGGDALASYFKSFLESNGFKVFFDLQEQYTGDFREYISNAVKSSDVFLLIMSEGSLERLHDVKDVVRMELEVAFENEIPILPITLYGDSIFEEMDRIGLPKKLKGLRDQNFRQYDHSTQQDTLNFILGACRKIRSDKFKLKITKPTEDVNSILRYLNRFDEVNDLKISYIKAFNNVINLDKDNSYFTGVLKDGYPYGPCEVKDFSSGKLYEIDFMGTFSFDGEGRIYKNEELYYEGNMKNFEPNGYGIMYLEEEIFEGHIYNGTRTGEGRIKFENGDIYEGSFRNNQLGGMGYIRYSNGDEYKGSFSSGKADGRGILVKADGTIYEGEFFKGNFRNGVIVSEGKVYIGRNFTGDLTNYTGEISIYKEDTGLLLMQIYYQDGRRHGNSENLKLGVYINEIMGDKLEIPEIGFKVDIDDGEYYLIKTIYREDKRLNCIQIIDKYGNNIYEKAHQTKNIHFLTNILKTPDNIQIEESSKKYVIRTSQGKMLLKCDYICKNKDGEFADYGSYQESMQKGFSGIDFDLIKDDFDESIDKEDINIKTGNILVDINEYKKSQVGYTTEGEEVKILNIKTELPSIVDISLD